MRAAKAKQQEELRKKANEELVSKKREEGIEKKVKSTEIEEKKSKSRGKQKAGQTEAAEGKKSTSVKRVEKDLESEDESLSENEATLPKGRGKKAGEKNESNLQIIKKRRQLRLQK